MKQNSPTVDSEASVWIDAGVEFRAAAIAATAATATALPRAVQAPNFHVLTRPITARVAQSY